MREVRFILAYFLLDWTAKVLPMPEKAEFMQAQFPLLKDWSERLHSGKRVQA
jgi:hypothetical protein